ncbi:hypothetical protein [Halorussus marinus]|uniref:hypothetical protein n=1 Tax=Halorussus marinus TaxID=2505976 RepID=UPI00106E9AD3|nr:hypothetical protein [Halorussus marinus]
MTSHNLLSLLAVLLILMTTVTGAVGTVAASPSPSGDVVADDVQFQQETPTPDENDTANNSTNNTTSTATQTDTGDFAGTNDSGDSGDSGDTVVVQVGDGDDSDSSSNESNSSATAGDDEPPFNLSQADYQFPSGVLLQERGHGDETVTFIVYNPTDSEIGVIYDNGVKGEGDGFYLAPGESRKITAETSGWILRQSTAVTTEVLDIESFEGGKDHTVDYHPLVINWNPSGSMGPLIGVIGGIAIILMFVAVMKFNLRVGRIAIPLTGQPVQGLYSEDDLPDRDDPYRKQAKDILHGYGILAVVGFKWIIGSLAFWDLYPIAFFWELLSGFGRLYDPSTLVTLSEVYSNLMVYWAYDVVLFIVPVWIIGKWYLKRNGVYLHDIDPKTGDNHTYLLSPTRFADLAVFKKGRDPETGRRLKPKPVEKNRLAENNKDTDRRSYECENYDPRKNAAYLSWEGEKKKVKPSQLRRHDRLVDYLLETTSTLWDRYGNLRDKFTILAQQESRRLNAKQTAQIEGGILEDGENTRDRLDSELQEAGFDDVVEGEERTIEDVVKSSTDEDAPHLESDAAGSAGENRGAKQAIEGVQ